MSPTETRSLTGDLVRTVEQILDDRAITSVLQPIVDITNGDVVGYEALARGPKDSPARTPDVLFAAAAEVGRLDELDWICRASALRAGMDARLGRDTPLFVNVEPATLRTPCPRDLAPAVELALRELDLVFELTERALADDPARVLEVVALIRAAGHRVAIDDVGAEPESLALLSFVHPDVIKLDISLMRDLTDGDAAAVINAVRAEAERIGAAVLAEGIEDAADGIKAIALGATLGQGWFHGLPATPAGTRAAARHRVAFDDTTPIPRVTYPGRGSEGSRRTPFEIIAAQRPVQLTEKRFLQPTSRHLEEQALAGGTPVVLLACFQDAVHFTPDTRRRFAELARRTTFTAAIGRGLPDEPAPGIRGARLEAGEALVDEWNVIVVGAHFAGALVARDLGDTGDDPSRRFEFAVSHDRDLVVQAARSLMDWVTPVPH